LPDRHARDDLIDQVCGALRHAPRAARGAKPAPLAGKRHQLLVATPGAAQPQEAMGKDAAFQESIEPAAPALVSRSDEPGRVRTKDDSGSVTKPSTGSDQAQEQEAR